MKGERQKAAGARHDSRSWCRKSGVAQNHLAVAEGRCSCCRGGSMQSYGGSPWNEATQDGRWPIACRKLKGRRKDVQMHL